VTTGQRFARLVTTVVVRAPFLWRLFRRPLTREFDHLAPVWNATRVSRERLAPMVAALESGDYGLAVGSRYVPGGGIENWPKRRIITSKVACMLARPLIIYPSPVCKYAF